MFARFGSFIVHRVKIFLLSYMLAHRSTVQDYTLFTPILLLFWQTPRYIHWDKTMPGDPRTRWSLPLSFTRNKQQKAGIRQTRNYDTRARGRDWCGCIV